MKDENIRKKIYEELNNKEEFISKEIEEIISDKTDDCEKFTSEIVKKRNELKDIIDIIDKNSGILDTNYEDYIRIVKKTQKYINGLGFLYYSEKLVEEKKFKLIHLLSDLTSVNAALNGILFNYKLSKITCEYELWKKDFEKEEKVLQGFNDLGHTILNMIISFTIVTTAITAIDKINSNYMPIFVMTILWLCLSVIMFNHSIFNKYDFNSKVAKKIYFIITTMTVITLFLTIIFMYPNISPLGNKNNPNNCNNLIYCNKENGTCDSTSE